MSRVQCTAPMYRRLARIGSAEPIVPPVAGTIGTDFRVGQLVPPKQKISRYQSSHPNAVPIVLGTNRPHTSLTGLPEPDCHYTTVLSCLHMNWQTHWTDWLTELDITWLTDPFDWLTLLICAVWIYWLRSPDWSGWMTSEVTDSETDSTIYLNLWLTANHYFVLKFCMVGYKMNVPRALAVPLGFQIIKIVNQFSKWSH